MNNEYGGILHNPFIKDDLSYVSEEVRYALSDASLYITLVVVGSIVIPQAINIAGSIINKEKRKS